MSAGARTGVLLAGDGEDWERPALEVLGGAADLVLLRRCLDLTELLAAAGSGAAQVAVVGHRSAGLDRDAVDQLRAAGIAVVVVVAPGGTRAAAAEQEQSRLLRLGAAVVVSADEVGTALADGVRAAALPQVDAPAAGTDPGPGAAPMLDETPSGPAAGRVLAVWGPHGAPGRTTLAVALAATAAARGVPSLVVDADPHGGAVGQHLGVLEEASGLLAALRLANAGSLDAARFAASARTVEPGLAVLTGLPRADRWSEVRPGPLAEVLHLARALADLVLVDLGSGLEPQAGPGPVAQRTRESLVTGVLEDVDDVVVVASADPVGLTRLARSLVDLRVVRPDGPGLVVVNRMRPGLGWRERDVADMVARVSPRAEVVFVADDVATADRALVSGRTLAQLDPRGSTRLGGGVARLTDRLLAGDSVRR